jgi:hypothetical protein
MFFRGRQAETSVWRRFRADEDGFTFERRGDHYVARVAANAERVVDLFHALSEALPPTVDVTVEDGRTGVMWSGRQVALPDVREAIARLKVPLATHGGVEIAVYSAEDQLTLSAHLELFLYARTDHWLYVMVGKGLVERSSLARRSWRFAASRAGAAPDLTQALGATVDRLGLRRA